MKTALITTALAAAIAFGWQQPEHCESVDGPEFTLPDNWTHIERLQGAWLVCVEE